MFYFRAVLKIFLLIILLPGISFITKAQIVQVGSATTATTSTSTLIIPKPAGLAVSDLMIVQIDQSGSNNGVSTLSDATSSGWIIITGSDIRVRNGNYNRATILYKIADVTDVGATGFSFTLDGNADNGQGAILAFSGVNTTTPFDATPGTGYDNINNDNKLNANSINVSTEYAAVLMLGAYANDRSVNNWPAGFAELYDEPLNVVRDMGMAAAVHYNVSTGATGDLTADLSGNAFNGSILIALRPDNLTTPPTCTSVFSPVDGASNIAVNSGLTWGPVFGATGYRIYFGTDAQATNIENGTDLGNVTSYTPASGLSFLTDYYWKIVPYNSNGSASGCPEWSFTTEDVYCIPGYTHSPLQFGDYVALVQLGDISNATGAETTPPYYTYYNTLSTGLTVGGNYTITVGSGYYFELNNIAVWIDFDQSGTFDSSEKLGQVVIDGNSTGTINFLVPANAQLGTTRMRVREVYNTSNLDPCQTYEYGETEDYNVNITLACNDGTLTLTTGNSDQSVCNQQPISDISYTVGGSATGATVSGLPAGLNSSFSGGVFTISGSPTETGTFNFTVTTTGTPASCSEATELGSITVNSLPAAPTANNVTTTYNGSVQSASASAGAGETVDWYTDATGSTPATAPSGTDAGVYTAWAEARNTTTGCVSASRTRVTLTINKKNLQVTAVAPNITYGDAAPAVTVQYSGFAGTDDASVLDNTGFVLGTDYVQGDPAGTYNTTISIGTATDNNYNFIPLNSSTFTVGKKTLLVTAGNQSVSYGTQLNTVIANGTYSLSGFVNGDNSAVITGLNSITYLTNYTETTNAGTPGIVITPVITGLSATNYNFTAVAGNITIGKTDQFVSFNFIPFTKPLNEFDIIDVGTSSTSGLPVTVTMEPGSAAILHGSPGNYYLTDIGETGFVILYANQAGDVNFNPAPQVTRYFDVTKSNQNISFPSIDDVTYFNGLTIDLEAVASSGLAVSYLVISGPATVSGNTLTITGAGQVFVQASQPGNAAFNAAADVIQSFNVAKGPQTITINVPPGAIDETTQISATSTSGLPVTLTLGTGSAATGLIDHGTYYTLTGIGASGSIYIVGNQSGDSNFLPADQVIQTIEIGKSNQTITFNPIPNQTYSPTLTVPLTATASSGLTVSFTLISGPATLAGNTLTITGVGTVVVEASQPGDAVYNAAPPVTRQFEVLKATPVIVQADIVKNFGDPDFSITPASNSSGSFSFVSGNDQIFTMSGNVATITGTGTTTLDITQQPTAYYYGKTKTISFTVNKSSSTISVTGPVNYVYNATHQGPASADVTGSTGAVTYSYYGTGSTIYGPSAVQPENAGTYEVIATVAADANYSSATSAPYAFTIAKADAVISVTPYSVTYDGTQHTATGSAQGINSVFLAGLDLTGTTHTDAGNYNNDPWTFTDVTGNYNNASGTVNNVINQRNLTVTAIDQEKCEGETITFSGSEFTATGLQNGETIGSVTLISAGASAGATSGTYSIVPSNASGGTFNPANYSISYSNGTMLVNPAPTLTGATQDSPVCEGNQATILLSGLQPGTTFNLDYEIDGAPQTTVTGLTAVASGNSSFSTRVLTASDDGMELRITGITITSASPNCSSSFSESVTLQVNPTPTLAGFSQAATVCEGSAATIQLTGLLPSSTFTLTYVIDGGAPLQITGLTSDASGNAGFNTAVLSSADNGEILGIRALQDETTGCSATFSDDIILSVDPASVGGTAVASETIICENSSTTVSVSGYTGTDIQWEQSANGVSGWADVTGGSGERTDTYTTAGLGAKTWFRARITSGVCAPAYSNAVAVDIYPQPTLTSATQDATVCEGSQATINLTGLQPNLTFTLKYHINNGIPVTVTGVSSNALGEASFSTVALVADNDGETLQIFEIENETTGCTRAFTRELDLSVNEASFGGTVIPANTSICENESTSLLVSGYVGAIQWQQSADGVSGWTNVSGGSGATAETYTTPALTETTYYRAALTNGVCSVSYSNVVQVTVNPLPATGEIIPD